MDRMNSDFLPRIAPTEYHVGIKPSHVSVLMEESTASDGVATPTPDSDDDEIVDIDVEGVESCSNIKSSLGDRSLSTQFDSTSTCVPIDERCPLSVQRLISKKVN